MSSENETVTVDATTQAANDLLARVTGDATTMAELKNAMAKVDDVSSTGGYDDALVVANDINLSLDHLAKWLEPENRSKPDTIGAVVNQIHDAVAPLHGPTMLKLYNAAFQLALDAAPYDEAVAARVGDWTTDKPQYQLVNVASTRGDNKKNAAPTGNEAFDKLYTSWQDANGKGETELAKVYAQACACAVADADIDPDTLNLHGGSASKIRIARLRQMGADKQAKQVAAGKFKSILFLPHVSDLIDDFRRVSGKNIGDVWDIACAKARAAHRNYVKSLREEAKKDITKGVNVNVAVMSEAMRVAASDYLTGKSGTKEAKSKEVSEKIADANKAMFANARKLHDLGAPSENFSEMLAKAISDGLFDDGQFMTAIGVVMDCAGLKTEELERRRKEQEEREQKAQREQMEKLQREENDRVRREKKAAAETQAKADIETKAQAAKQQAAIDEQNAAAEAAATTQQEETAEQKLAAKRAKKSAA